MKTMFMAATVAATLFAPLAGAQNRGFEGFSLGLNVNSATTSTDFTASGGFGPGLGRGRIVTYPNCIDPLKSACRGWATGKVCAL